jgi:gamma-glutamylcyclotransferase (GGCT)/AIG2-like uncharacterized protein YtfP
MNLKVFVYGILRRQINHEMSNKLRSLCDYLGAGFVNGRLYDTGFYPGAIPENDEEFRIYGDLYELNDRELLFELDDFENIGPDYPNLQEFTRIEVPVFIETQTLISWMYAYNWPVEDQKLIGHGDYVRYISRLNGG